MNSKEKVIEQIRTMIANFSPEERLSILREIANTEPDVGSDTEMLDQIEISERNRLWAEQEAWFARPPQERFPYRGQYIAILGGQVIDSDPEQRTLYLRIRSRFGRAPVLIINGDWDEIPEITIHTTHIVAESARV